MVLVLHVQTMKDPNQMANHANLNSVKASLSTLQVDAKTVPATHEFKKMVKLVKRTHALTDKKC